MNFEKEKQITKEILIALINNGLLTNVAPEDKLAKTKEAFS